MVDDKNSGTPDELLDGDEAEVAEAEALARALDGSGGPRGLEASGAGERRGRVDPLDLQAVELLRAGFGKEPPLGELRARSIVRGAIQEARTAAAGSSARRASRLVWIAAAAAALLLVVAGGRLLRPSEARPEELCSRSAGMLVPGPFPSTQSAADRLDLVTEDRLLALRENHYRSLAGGRR